MDATAEEADVMHYGWNDGGWGIFWMVFTMVAVVALALIVLRTFASGPDRREPPKSPKDLLAEHFAHGDITAEEYRQRLSVLEETRQPQKRAGSATR
jgi:uncharacterized membrane protein